MLRRWLGGAGTGTGPRALAASSAPDREAFLAVQPLSFPPIGPPALARPLAQPVKQLRFGSSIRVLALSLAAYADYRPGAQFAHAARIMLAHTVIFGLPVVPNAYSVRNAFRPALSAWCPPKAP